MHLFALVKRVEKEKQGSQERDGRGRKEESKGKKREWKKEENDIFMDMDIYRFKKMHKEKGRKKRGEKGKHFFFSPVIAGPGRHLYSTRRKC